MYTTNEVIKRISTGQYLDNTEIFDLINENPVAAAKSIELLQNLNLKLYKELDAQEVLNRNLIRISIERKNKENKQKRDSAGFQLINVSEITDLILSERLKIDCFKIRLQTPYDINAFCVTAARRQFEADFDKIQAMFGKIIKTDLKALLMTFEGHKNRIAATPNYAWDFKFEADYIRQVWSVTFFAFHEIRNNL